MCCGLVARGLSQLVWGTPVGSPRPALIQEFQHSSALTLALQAEEAEAARRRDWEQMKRVAARDRQV